MIHLHDLPDSAAMHAMETGEFPQELIEADHVAIIMTQSWCIEWLQMSSWLARLAKKGKPDEWDIQVYTLMYDKTDYFHRFMEHKEEVFGNHLIPYLRYYSKGVLKGESNYLPRGAFLQRFDS